MFDTDDVDEAKRMLPIYKRAVDLLETVSGKKTEQAEQEPGFYGRAAARLSQRVKELELEQSGKWRDHVEHRMLTWKTSHMNESGDQLALKDFMDEHILNDLIDFVCDEYTAPVEHMRQEPVHSIRVASANCGALVSGY